MKRRGIRERVGAWLDTEDGSLRLVRGVYLTSLALSLLLVWEKTRGGDLSFDDSTLLALLNAMVLFPFFYGFALFLLILPLALPATWRNHRGDHQASAPLAVQGLGVAGLQVAAGFFLVYLGIGLPEYLSLPSGAYFVILAVTALGPYLLFWPWRRPFLRMLRFFSARPGGTCPACGADIGHARSVRAVDEVGLLAHGDCPDCGAWLVRTEAAAIYDFFLPGLGALALGKRREALRLALGHGLLFALVLGTSALALPAEADDKIGMFFWVLLLGARIPLVLRRQTEAEAFGTHLARPGEKLRRGVSILLAVGAAVIQAGLFDALIGR